MRKIALFVVIALTLALPAPALANPYTLWDGGNCCWYAWEMAKQHWGVDLPWAGDARCWRTLDGAAAYTVTGQVYHVRAVNKPVAGSIMVFQPIALDALNGGKSFTNDHYGHVAWVYAVDNIQPKGWQVICVRESGIWPPKGWDVWHGCEYRDNYYYWPPGGMKGVGFLTLGR
ncbi:CHAP domain-containing protein [Desulfotomaculum copahuensis]|uniref:Peptidase C51 domain-containing protein n=1 Tax=Desulfotomaculum copahuensis TaxID=1838280 RepID=A0A1B7LG27_9FIRM|nr:CHAP domain-containing protein [Desulfotomaculum copahuensis]OAT83674.1 hypothetical protein A6M21_07505 [Desulfotomaculum copahuensis]